MRMNEDCSSSLTMKYGGLEKLGKIVEKVEKQLIFTKYGQKMTISGIIVEIWSFRVLFVLKLIKY